MSKLDLPRRVTMEEKGKKGNKANEEAKASSATQFGSELARYRREAGLTQRQLATAVPMSPGLVGMLEKGERFPTREVADGLDKALGLGTTLRGLRERLDRIRTPDAWFRTWLEFEQVAHTLYIWEPLMVPGLLQTEAYARAVLSHSPHITEEQVEDKVTARLARQAILYRSPPTALWVVLDEGVLHRPIGGPKVMREQLEHLTEMGARKELSIQVSPIAAVGVLGLLGGLAVAEMTGFPERAAYAESQPTGSDRTTTRPQRVRGILFRHSAVRGDALPRRESRALIRETMERWT
ncbi:helix-turn-helix transcriptional regulator [Streptosporangium sp. NPDC020072]|uniref:helix-turn-helix domain-containing protein n=1 Tax=Streptosporangium sp. NPDC020072 TaxID=3154788 RepID=UPI003421ABF1